VEALNPDFDQPDIPHAVRMLRAVHHALEAAGSMPTMALVRTVAVQYAVDPGELGARLLAVLVAGHAARRALTEEAAEQPPRPKAAA
jgi:hypothetical protein